ncbi:MAG: aminotransferase class I/II-fold pyridoxal phosphate-dependent enzyme [Thermoplasmatales archaeon]|nr:aminotransferase class I/II-fold pyridoxal phosphate-dependent enzyme [Thermoplasmatales archaeon]
MEHGGAREGEEKLKDFSYSANPYRPPFVKRVLERAKIERYPYCNDRLENGIKNKLGIQQDVVITAGITEQIQIIITYFRKRRFVSLRSTYGEYVRTARLLGSEIRIINNPDPGISELTPKRGDVLFFANPNNPSGKYYRYVNELAEQAEAKNFMLVLDEAFIDFVDSIVPLEINDNVVVMRSFSKAYNLSGMRIGYAITSKPLAEKFREMRLPWGIGTIGCELIEYILRNRKFLSTTLEKIRNERRRISETTGLRTDANYFLASVGSATIAGKRFKENGILVRDCSSFGLTDAIRFSIKSKKDNDLLLSLLGEIEVKVPEYLSFQ